MTTDIKERLRVKAARMEAIDFVICAKLYREAADYIEQLEARLSAQTAVKTEQPSLSDHEIYVFLCDLTVLRQACENDEELIPKVRVLLSAQRQDSDKDAERYRWLRDRLSAADFCYSDPPRPVLVFDWPANVGVGGNCDRNIDAAIANGIANGAPK